MSTGALFGDDQHEEELLFRFAVDRINSDSTILAQTTLVPQIERVDHFDSFHANKRVCSLLNNGVVAIFGPSGLSASSSHTQSICDALEIPHVETSWDFQIQRDDLSINLYPKTVVLAKAYIDLVKAWNWKVFAIAYETNEGIIRIQEFLKEAERHDWQIFLYQFKPGKPYRDTFWEINKSHSKIVNIVLDVKHENLVNVLRHAQQVGMMTEIHSYLITSLDLHTVDLEDFKFGNTKISSFRLVDVISPELQDLMSQWSLLASKIGKKHILPPKYILTDSALVYDGVKLLATALQDLDQSQSVDGIQPISCENGSPWLYGSSLINYMRPITFRGITGLVGFDQSGYRSNFALDVMSIFPDGLQKIGYWTENSQVNGTSSLQINSDMMKQYSVISMKNVMLRVTTIISEPYTMWKESAISREGNQQYEGFAVDLIEELSKIMGFSYRFQLVKDNAYGIKDENGNWNGMIGELIRNEADIAIVDLTISSKREEAVDFTQPFMNTGISILFKKPTTKVTTLFSFLSPFQNIVWIYVLGAYISVSTILFIVGRLTPYEWDDPHPCRQGDNVLENNFSLINSFSFTIGTMMQQGSAVAPKAMSTRTVAAIWYFFTLIMISSYTANLAAFLTVEKVIYPIEDAEGMASQTQIKYGCLGTGTTKAFFAESKIPTHQRMWAFMKNNPSVFTKSNRDGIERVQKSNGNYAYLMESASIEYKIERDCNLTQIGGLLDTKGYGIASPKDSPYRNPLSHAILKLHENGILLQLKDRWWKQKKGGGKCAEETKKSSAVNNLSIDHVGGVFVVLLGGLTLSFLVAIFEFIWKARKSADKEESVIDEMIKDLRFAFACQSKTKIVQKNDDFVKDKFSDSCPPQYGSDYNTIY
ncbi:glutamate receptor ionotropic, kainate 2-like [Oppia nitens]|uniref:glutamate receptor ionotropic, kainate 2-like n=1 Tax=Oppia nitens TaxID=1686743 RepID=UPI0023D9A766|nr:glutamate receptor ionotropic, kainate 2-like [Oppia nitens]